MKIERVIAYHLRAELGPAEVFAYSQAWVRARTAMLVEITTDDGRSGWGEAYGPPAPGKTIVDELYAPRLIGRDAVIDVIAHAHVIVHVIVDVTV